MSYLRLPRLTFSGKFLADPSTVNNDPEHYDNANFKAQYQQPSLGNQPNGWWNPNGSGAFRLKDCVVTRVFYADGTACDDPNVDPIVSTPVTDDTSNTEAKLVDLDSEHQMTSQIWGLKVFVGKTASGMGLSGEFAAASFMDLFQPFIAGSGDASLAAAFQSVLQSIKWAGAGTSRLLGELSSNGAPTQLSIKFNVDGYNDDSTSPAFTSGRIVGSIGPQLSGEPSNFVAARVLESVGDSSLNAAYAEIVGNTLTIDLGNSLNTQASGGALANLGTLNLAVHPPGAGQVTIGAVPYTGADWYAKTAGIASFVLDPNQLAAASAAPLAIVRAAASGTPLLAEPADGIWIRADETVFRLNPGDAGKTTLYATKFGRPTSGLRISLGYDSSIMNSQTNQGPIPGPQTVGAPTSALAFPASVTTGADGTADVQVAASDPGQPRQYIDGQLYGVIFGPGNAPPPVGSIGNASRILNFLVWSGYTAPTNPTWSHDVRPILQQYANLYPVMKQYVDLSDYSSVVASSVLIQSLLSLPITDPRYMPVTRDLSDAKKAMILNWLNSPIQ